MEAGIRRRRRNRWIAAAVIAVVVGLVAVDLAQRYLGQVSDQQTRETLGDYNPPFHVGDPAPDFSLPDAGGKRRNLASLVRRDTLLCLLCGCDRCRQMQTYLGKMLKSLGTQAPTVVSISSAPPDSEAAWKRDTGVPQTMVYDSKAAGVPVIQQYRGEPCPRIYRLSADRKVTWIGPSPTQVKSMDDWGQALARQLGVSLSGATPGASGINFASLAPRCCDHL